VAIHAHGRVVSGTTPYALGVGKIIRNLDVGYATGNRTFAGKSQGLIDEWAMRLICCHVDDARGGDDATGCSTDTQGSQGTD